MPKSIKKSYIFLIVLAAVIILLPSVLFSIVRTPVVQTYMMRKIMRYISEETKSTVIVGKINFSFFNKLVINDILIKDQHNDTLLFIPEITTGIRYFDFRKNVIKLGKVVIVRPVVGFATDSTGLMNLTWYFNMFQKSKDSTGKRAQLFISIRSILVMEDFRFRISTFQMGKLCWILITLNSPG